MLIVVLSVLSLTTCYKWGAWKRWREFYPTILYVIIGDLTYNYVFHDYPLWAYDTILGGVLSCLIIYFIIYPPVTILFLTHYPLSRKKQALYILAWAAGGTLIETGALLADGINYYRGWNLFWSFTLFVGLFSFARLHYKRPLLTWAISFLCGIAISLIFGLPFPPP